MSQNPYIEVVRETFASTNENQQLGNQAVDYGAIVKSLPDSSFNYGEQELNLSDYLKPAENFSLEDGFAGGLDVSIENGVSFVEAHDNMKFYEAQKKKNVPAVQDSINKIDNFAPKTKDAIANLGVPAVSALWETLYKSDLGVFERVSTEGKLALEIGALGLQANEINYRRLTGTATEQDRVQLKKLEDAMGAYQTEYRKGEGWWTGSYRSLFSEFVPSISSIASEGIETGLVVGTATGVAGSVVPVIGNAISASAGLGAGFAAGAGAEIYRQSAAEAYASLRDLKDNNGQQVIDRETAQALAVTAGLGMAALDAAGQVIGFRQLRGIPGVDKILSGISSSGAAKALQAMSTNPTVMGMVGDAGKRILTAIAAESGTEALQEGVLIGTEAVGTALGQNAGFAIDQASSEEIGERLFGAAEGAAKATFLPALFGGVGGAGMSYRLRRKQAEMEQEGIKNIGEFVRNAPIMEKAPQFAKQLIANITADKPLYFEGSDLMELYQTEGGQDIISSMGISEGQIAEAVELGVDVAVPVANQVDLMRSTFWQGENGMESKAKLSPRSQTPQNIDALFNGDLEDVSAVDDFTNMLNEVNADVEKKNAWLEATNSYRYQLERAGYTPQQAEDFSMVLGAHAEIMAPLFGETPQDYLQRKLKGFEYVTPKQYAGVVNRFRQGEQQGNVLLQPINEGVDLDAPVQVISIEPRFTGQNPKILRKRFPDDIKQNVLNAFSEKHKITNKKTKEIRELKGVLNEDTGTIIDLTSNDFNEHIKFDDNEDGIAHLEAMQALPELVRTSKLVESYGDRKTPPNPNIKKMHRYQGALRIGDKDYSVKLTVKEFKDGTMALDTDNPIKIYHHRLEKEMLAGNSVTLQENLDVKRPSASIHEYTIRQLISDVKDSEDTKFDEFFQSTKDATPYTARGVYTQRDLDGQAMIALFKGKNDISTVIHEGAGHMFLEHLREAAQLNDAPLWVQESWATLVSAIGVDIDPSKPIGKDAHEKFARMATEYFRQGKAPNTTLQGAFRMFGKWLSSIYRMIKRRLGDFENISPEVKKVMDRLLATDEDIKKAESLYGEDVAPENVDVNEWAEYLKLKNKARQSAEAAIELRRVEGERTTRREASLEANVLMVSDLNMQKLRRLKALGGINYEDLQQAFSEEGAFDIKAKWDVDKKKLVKKDGKLSVEDVMAEMGFQDMNELMIWLFDGTTEQDFRNSVIDARLLEWEENYSPEAESVGSVASDAALKKRDELLSGQEQIDTKELIFGSEKRAAGLPLSALDGEYEALLVAEQKEAARKLSVETVRKLDSTRNRLENKIETIIGSERLRRARLGAAYRARIEREDIKRKVRKLANSKTINIGFKQQILQLIAMYKGLGTKSQRPQGAVPSIREFWRQYAIDNGMDVTQATPIPDWLDEHLDIKNIELRFNDLTIEQMRDLYQMIKQLEHKGRFEDKLINDVNNAEIEATAQELTVEADKLSGTKHINEHERKTMLGAMRQFFREQHASKVVWRFVWKQMDGFVSKGSNTDVGKVEQFMRQLNDAENKELSLNNHYMQELEKALLPLANLNTDKPFKIDGVPLQDDVALDWGGQFTMEKVFAIALNMGNEGNKAAIQAGFGWSDEDVTRILDYMTPELWESVQQIWDAIDELYPLINDVYKKENGLDMQRVEASPYTTFKDGQVIELRGGYYPLIFDKRFSKVAAANENFDALNSHEAVLRNPKTASGMTKERKGGKLPPLLSLSVISRHLTDSIHYATHTLPLRDIYKVVSTKTFENSFKRAFGEEMHAEILPWLRSIAQPENKIEGTQSKIIDWLTKRGTFAVLGFSVRTALMGFASVSNSAHKVGWGNLLGNMAKFAVNPFKYVRMVRDLSPYMQNRSTMLDRDVRATTRRVLGQSHMTVGNIKVLNVDKYNSMAFAMITAIDAVVAMPTWLAQYEKSLAESNNAQKALQDADAAVYEAQGGAGKVDMSAMMRDPGAARLLTVFMTFANKHYNQQSYYWRGFVESMRKDGNSALTFQDFAVFLAATVFIPGLVVSMMFGMGQEGELPESEEYLFWEPLSIMLMGNPILRLIPSAIRYGSSGKFSALRGIDNLSKAFSNGYDILSNNNTSQKKMDAFMWSCLHAAGFFAKLPTVQLQRTVKGIEQQDKGKGGPAQFLLGPSYKKGKKG